MFDKLDKNIQDLLLTIYERYNTAYDLLGADIDDFPTKPYGDGNPYHYCSYCHKSIIDIDIDNGHHNPNCEWLKKYNDFDIMKSRLPVEVSEKLEEYFDEITYE